MTAPDNPTRPTLPKSFPSNFTGTWGGWSWKDGKPMLIVGNGTRKQPGTVALHD